MLAKEDGRERFERVVSKLGRPHSRGDRFALYNVDCVEAFKTVADCQIDTCITSPPYNIGKEYEQSLTLGEYIQWCEKWLNEVYRVTRTNGAFWLNLGYNKIEGRGHAVPLPYLLWDKTPFFLMQEIVWNYGAGVSARKFLSPRNEKFLWYVKNKNDYSFNLDEIRDPDVKYPNQKKNGKLRCNSIGKNPSDVWTVAKVTSGKNRSSSERAPHPAQFPLDIIDRIVKGFSNSGDLILDPFIGSGTTAVSSIRNGRFAVGFEINHVYLEYAAKRVTEAENDLFF